MTLELEIDVPESRTITLPPEVPVGRVQVSVSVPSPTDPPPFPPTADKFEREKDAFRRLLPELLTTHRGQYVAIHDGQVVEVGTSRLEVVMATFRRVGAVPIYVELVTEDLPRVYRIPGLRLARREEVK